MISKDIALGLLFLFQTGLGVLGNSFLLGLYTITFLTGPSLRPIDVVISHLALVNDLVLLSKGIPHIMTTLGLTNFLDDVGCKLIFYCHKVARDLSLCTTCLLTSFQAITLSGKSFWWATINAGAPKYIVPLFVFCWTFYLLTNHLILFHMKAPKKKKNITEGQDFLYCVAAFQIPHNIATQILTVSLPDVLCIGIMVGTSAYMVFVLYKHHQRAQYIHGNSLKPSCYPETRATQTILLLVILFVSFYSLNSIAVLCMHYRKSSWLVHTSTFLAASFPACSSFILISSDSKVWKYFFALWEKMLMQF